MRHLIGLSFAILFLGGAGVSTVGAADGAFPFLSTTTRTCIEDTEGFDANLQPIPLPSFLPTGTHFIRVATHTDTGQGIFNIGNTLTSSLDGTSIRSLDSTTPVTSTHSDCTGTWNVLRNDSGPAIQSQSTCTFSTTAGGTSTGTVSGLVANYQLVGLGSGTNNTLTLVQVGPVPPVVETVHVDQNGATAAFDYQRLCTRTTTLYFSQPSQQAD